MNFNILSKQKAKLSFKSYCSFLTDLLGLPAMSLQQNVLLVICSSLILLVILECSLASPLVAVAIIVCMVIILSAIIWPSFALLLIFACAGLPSLIVQLPGHTMRPIEASLLLCLLVVFLHRPGMRFALPHWLALLFTIIGVISFIHVPTISTDPNAYAADKRLFTVFLALIALFCGTFLISYIKNISSFLVALLLANIPLYLVGLAQSIGIFLPYPLEPNGAKTAILSDGRLWGPFNGAATFGLYLVNLFIIALVCWLFGIRRRDRFVGAIMVVATVAEMQGAGTRSAVLAVGVLTLFTLMKMHRFKLLLSIMGLLAITTAFFFNKIIAKFVHPASSTDNRLFLWQEAIKIILSHPWIGIGLEQFPTYYVKLIVGLGSRLSPTGISVHNQYLDLALDSGLIWLIIHILLLISIIYLCMKFYTSVNREQKMLLASTILVILANMITSFFDVPFSKAEGTVLIFLLAGLSLGCIEQLRQKSYVKGISLSFQTFLSLHSRQTEATLIKSNAKFAPELKTENMHLAEMTKISEESTDNVSPNTQKTGRTILIRLISWGIAIPIIFPVTALLTRYLGPIQYGEYSFTFPFFAVFALLSGTGMDPLIIRQLSRKKHKEWSTFLSYAAGSRLLSTAFSAGASVIVAFLMPVSMEQRSLLLLGSLSLFFSFSFNGLRMIYSNGFSAEQRAGVLFLLETANRVVTAGLVLVIVFLHFPIFWAYFLLVYSDIPFFIIEVFIARRRYNIKMRFSVKSLREHLISSISMTGYDALALINSQVDVILLLMLAGPLSVGIYALAMRITDPLQSIAGAYVGGMYPLLCAKFEEGREQFAKVYQEAIRVLSLGVVPLALYIILEADTIVSLLGGARFAVAVPALQFLMAATAMIFFHGLSVRACAAANMERWSPYMTVISTSVNFVVNLLLIPHIQYIGAGIAALASETVGVCLYSALLARYVHLPQALLIVVRVLLANMPMVAFLLWQKHTSLLLTTPVAVLLCILGYFITRVLTFSDLFTAWKFMQPKGQKGPGTDIRDLPTLVLPRVYDVSDLPTTHLPRIQI